MTRSERKRAEKILTSYANKKGMIDSDIGFKLMFGPSSPDKMIKVSKLFPEIVSLRTLRQNK